MFVKCCVNCLYSCEVLLNYKLNKHNEHICLLGFIYVYSYNNQNKLKNKLRYKLK